MKFIPKLFNIKILSLIFVIYYVLSISQMYFFPDEIKSVIYYNIKPLAFFTSVFFVPITEEIIFRYWAYGKNVKLQFSFFLSFVFCLLTDIFQKFLFEDFYIINNVNIDSIVQNSIIILIGLMFYFYCLIANKKVPLFFTKLVNSRFKFIFIVILFALIHVFGPGFFDFQLVEYFDYLAMSFIITGFARNYGLYLSTIWHILINAVAFISQVVFVRNSAKSLVSDHLLYSYLFITIIIMILSFICIFKVKKINCKFGLKIKHST